jgi:uncharacterized protein (TIGR03067 family)
MKKLGVLLAVCLFFSATGVGQEDAKSDKDKLQGTWQSVSAERKGKSIPELKLVIEGDTLAVERGGRTLFKGKITLDPSKRPKTMDWELTNRAGAKTILKGIYEIEGDTLKYCHAGPPGSADRPKQFATNAKEDHMLYVLKREKK